MFSKEKKKAFYVFRGSQEYLNKALEQRGASAATASAGFPQGFISHNYAGYLSLYGPFWNREDAIEIGGAKADNILVLTVEEELEVVRTYETK